MKIFQTLLLVLLIASCGRNKDTNTVTTITGDDKVFVVQDVIQTSKYTYLHVEEDNTLRWVAVSKIQAMAGDRYYYDKVHTMTDFHSKELNRDFESVDFINHVSKTPLSQVNPSVQANPAPMMKAPHGHAGKVSPAQNLDISLLKSAGELSIAQIFRNPQQFANKQIEIKGKVVKVNKNIMGRNWIHIQDGTSHNNNFDLTITSKQTPMVNQVVSFEGTVMLNKDFGSGYFYDVIVENGVMQ
ncbi:hypothetical protein [Saccharicrinis sp. 156]|uniref:hypothetical protein n=1 Tax=Saccharicrinis sp. 156 TaxID=3417574 RepID=UPI003D327AF9